MYDSIGRESYFARALEILSARVMAEEVPSWMDRPRDTRQPLAGNMRGMVWVMAATLSQAVGGAAHKVVVVEVPSVQTLVFLRALVALVLLLPIVLASRGHAIKTRNFKLHVIRGLLLAINVFCSTYAVTRLTLAEANTYALTTSLFLLPLGTLLLGEHAHYLRWVGGTIGFVGVLVMLRPGFSSFQWAAVIALLGALATALLSVVLKRVSGGDSAVAINFWSLAASALVFGIPTRFYVPTLPVMMWSWVLLGACSALAMGFCYVWAYRAGDASAVEVGSFALLFWGALIGLALFGESPTPHLWIGALIMIGGIVLVIIEPTSQAKEAR
jgi:S-adenosylmethionine uptake transporter